MQPRLIIAASVCTALLTACAQGSAEKARAVERGQIIYAKECAQCHGTRGDGAGPASARLDVVPPDLRGLKHRNDGVFPREYVAGFVLGLLEDDTSNPAMPDFAYVGLRHVYPDGGADGEVLEADFEDLLDYLEAIQD